MNSHSIAVLMCGALLAPAVLAQPAPMPPPEEPGTTSSSELAQARRELAEAARKVAELSADAADRWLQDFEFHQVDLPPVRLGVVVDREDLADGVRIDRVARSGPAAAAGLERDDLLLEVNGRSLARGEASRAPAMRVFEALRGTEAGDEVKVRYRRGRDAAEATVTLAERPHPATAFSFGFGDGPLRMVEAPHMPALHTLRRLRPFGNYEFAELNPGLGKYFNSERGLLVLSVGDENPLGLEDGDVVLSIDGREPESPTHAARILRSYVAGEEARLEIMRDRRKQTMSVTIPDAR